MDKQLASALAQAMALSEANGDLLIHVVAKGNSEEKNRVRLIVDEQIASDYKRYYEILTQTADHDFALLKKTGKGVIADKL